MTAKEYLNQAYLLEVEINAREKQIRELRKKGKAIYPNSTHRKISELKEQNSADELKLELLLQKNLVVINKVKEPQLRKLLVFRHIRFYPFEKIAKEMKYSLSAVEKLHVKALAKVEDILKTAL